MAISIKESIVAGVTDFWSRKIRSAVTILGILLGTMSIIVVLSLVNGIYSTTTAWMTERGGLTKIAIDNNREYDNAQNLPEYFTLQEIELIKSLIPEATAVNPQMSSWLSMSYRDKKENGLLMGVYPDYALVEEWTADRGRFINDFDVNQSADVVVIGTKIRDELFGSKNPLGQFITINDRRLQVIGIMEHKFLKNNGIGNANALGWMNRRALIPLSTMIHKGTGQDHIEELTVKAASPEEAIDLKYKLEAILLNLRAGQPVFRIESNMEQAEEMQKNFQTMRIIIFFISLVSLFVAGIVISNIMLATVQERTREIGIRLAVGARRTDIFIQIVVQTIIIFIIGGFIGVVVGLSLLSVVSGYLGQPIIAARWVIITAVASTLCVGAITGIFPALKACNLDPIKALHYE
ncbi:MAG: ABC transporter permease [Candidatus Cloacimonetes bacterium]|nr:ABC transporter permease [Candidatus Cloacimonadota bacterium]